ncbi:hypothetical protein [Shewanella waksmanii]|uniref:hypothetical protein n=1 Tax=Shewanella waksmanii TaxID=213783 RepID=UPI003735459D
MSNKDDVYCNNKVEFATEAIVVSDNELATKVLRSNSFKVVDLHGYLNELSEASGFSFKRLLQFVSLSPFFNEGKEHKDLRRIISLPFSKDNLDHWKIYFDEELECLNNTVAQYEKLDLVEYNFRLASKLIRPLVLGLTKGLPDDFERRLYNFQKLVEPLLSIRELLHLESEIEYLFSHMSYAIKSVDTFIPNSLPDLLGTDFSEIMSEEEMVILLLVVYGAKSPLIQTLSNIFLNVIGDKTSSGKADKAPDSDKFTDEINSMIFRSAALLHIHRVATEPFECEGLSVAKGDYILLRTRSPFSSNCPSQKGLGFGYQNHYCSGALVAKTIISRALPALLERFPNMAVESFSYDSSIHTAQAPSSLKVKLR